jgi:hypothetical protein
VSATCPPHFNLSLSPLLSSSLLRQDDPMQLVQCAVRGRRFARLDFQPTAGIYGRTSAIRKNIHRPHFPALLLVSAAIYDSPEPRPRFFKITSKTSLL